MKGKTLKQLLAAWRIAAASLLMATATAQTTALDIKPPVLPPSPDAASFTRYGSLPIGINTGTAQFSLPVYAIQSGHLSHTVSVGYSSNGVKVDEMATRVGINWNLKAGGVITRTVMDKPDGATGVYPVFYHGPAYVASSDTSVNNINDTLYNYVQQSAYSTPPDYQPDEYAFNMDGLSGRFLKRENGEWTELGTTGMRIAKNGSGFILTPRNGVQYFFYLAETTKNQAPEGTSLQWNPEAQPTAYYLTKILSLERDSIVFNYLPLVTDIYSAQHYYNSITQSYSSIANSFLYMAPSYIITQSFFRISYDGNISDQTGSGCTVPMPSGLSIQPQVTECLPNYLSSIDFNGGRMSFVYSDRDDVPGEKKLDSIKVKRAEDSALVKCVALHYTYSTVPFTQFDTYVFNPSTSLYDLDYTAANAHLRKRLFLTAFDEVSTDLSQVQTTSFEYDGPNNLPARLSYAQDRHGYFNGRINPVYFFPNDTWFDFNLGNNRLGADRAYSFVNARKGMLKKVTYPTGGFSVFDYSPNKTAMDYAYVTHKDTISIAIDTSTYNGQEVLSDTFHYDAGVYEMHMRWECDWASFPVSTFDEYGHAIDLEDAYHVDVQWYNVNNTSYNGGGMVQPVYHGQNGNAGKYLPTGTYQLKITANRPRLKAKLVAELWRKDNDRSDTAGIAGVRVKSVIDYNSDSTEAGRREFLYTDWEDSTGTTSSGMGLKMDAANGNEMSFERFIGEVYGSPGVESHCGYNTIHSTSQQTNFLTEMGTVLYTKVIELNTTADTVNNGGTEYEFYYDQKQYPLPITFSWPLHVFNAYPTVPAGAAYMNNDSRTGMAKSTKVFSYAHRYGSRAILQQTNNYYSMDTAHLLVDTFMVSKKAMEIPSGGPLWKWFSAFDIYRYWRYYGFLKLDSTVQQNFETTGTIVNRTGYTYSPNAYQPDTVKHWGSKGALEKQTMKYIADIGSGDPGYSLYATMQYANNSGAMLEQRNWLGSTELTAKRVAYTFFAAGPATIYKPSLVYSSQSGGTEETEATFQAYDYKGNMQQFTGRDGLVTTMIWGYNHRYPVAKVVGKHYATCIALLDTSIINSPSSDAALRTELAKLRTMLTGTFLLTTNTYSPLVGVTSETDSNGKTGYYEYDRFNRLRLVNDRDGNILRTFDYRYKQLQ